MVKKKGKSKRTTLKDKYKIQKRTAETHRKRKKEAKRDAVKGIVKHDHKKKKDPGIPNSWPFKQDLLKDIQRTKERQQQRIQDLKEKRKVELRDNKEEEQNGGDASNNKRTVLEELMKRAQKDQNQYESKQNEDDNDDDEGNMDVDDVTKKDGKVAASALPGAGQSSRRAYLRELKKVIDNSDVILQVLDARDPIGSRIHPTIENTILSCYDKKMVLVLNKIDLVPKKIVSEWLTYLRRSHPTIAIKANTQFTNNNNSNSSPDESTHALLSTVPVGMDGLLQLLKNYARTGGSGGSSNKNKTTVVVGIIGYPNVGKSSIINALKRSRAVGVSSRPGFTTSMQEVVLDRNVRLLDSPGVVFDDKSTLLGNCIDPDLIVDPVIPITALLKRCDHSSLLMTYNIPSFPLGDTMAFLCLVAKSYGRVLKGGIPDKMSAARAVLKDWNNGKIPFYTIPPNDMNTDKRNNDAIIVNSFGTEFDITKYDNEIMNTLNDNDEMDFVKISDTNVEILDESTTKEINKYLTNNNNTEEEDEEEDEMDEDSEEDDDDDEEE